MTTKTIKLLVFLALLVHGIGHIQGVICGFGVKFTSSTSNISWLLKGFGDNINRIICVILFFGASLFGIMAALAFKDVLFSNGAWQTLALISAIFSTVCLVLFPASLAIFFNKIGAIAVNLAIYYSILFKGQWPSVLFEE